MDRDTPIERVRYDLRQADIAKKRASAFRSLETAFRYNAEATYNPKRRLFRSKHTIQGYGPYTADVQLTEEDQRLLQEWLYLRAEQEDERAEAYENEALKVQKEDK